MKESGFVPLRGLPGGVFHVPLAVFSLAEEGEYLQRERLNL